MSRPSMSNTVRVTCLALAVLAAASVAHPAGSLSAAPTGPDFTQAREFIRLARSEPLKLNELTDRLSKNQAAALVTQIAAIARKKNPDVDALTKAIQILEAHRAMDAAQERLNSLLWVIALTLALFTLFFVYVIVDQRRSLRTLQALLAAAPASSGTDPGSKPVYRGE